MIYAEVVADLRPLRALKGKGIRTAVKIGVQRAAKPVREAVIANAEKIKKTGFLAKSIGTKVKQYPDTVIAVIGPKTSFKRVLRSKKRTRDGVAVKANPASYAHLVELGTRRSQKRPWLRPAHESTQGRYRTDVTAQIELEIQKTLTAAGG